MANLLHSESRRSYSWWWDSHISPKSSKWLQENLTDMDAKVKAMIKLIEEDADSFARRAEMYYKKRPELMKLVEDFYRAYRALAERYDHATVELRHAHRTMAAAFPNHLPYALADDSGSSATEVEPHTPEMTHPIHAFFDSDDFHKDDEGLASNSYHARRNSDAYSEEPDSGIGRKSSKPLNGIFSSRELSQNSNLVEGKMTKGQNVGGAKVTEQYSKDGVSRLLSENEDLKAQLLFESGRAGKAETEVQNLKKTLADIESEKDSVLLQYDRSLKKLSSMERELSEAQNDAGVLSEKASRGEIEIKILNEALTKLEAERDAARLQYNLHLERISDLENTLSKAQNDAKGLTKRAFKAETEAQNLKLELSILAAEKETDLLQYKKSLQMISALENKTSLAEENSRVLNEQTERAENEVKVLKEALTKLKEEKDDIAHRYEKCLETIAKMENEISCAQEDAKQLNGEILAGAAKLASMEEQRLLRETSNQSLQKEANNLIQKIAMKDQELSEKQKELEKLQTSLLEEQSRFMQVEVSLETLQKLFSQSQEEQRALTLELQTRLQMLKELEVCNQDLEENIQRVKGENQSLNESNKSSANSIKYLQDENFSLRELKEKLQKEVELQMDRSSTLQQEVYKLKEEIDTSNEVYLELLRQPQSAGLNPECIEASVRHLKEENSNLKEACNRHMGEKENLFNKLREMNGLVEENADLRCSVSELSGKLEGSREMIQELQKSCHFYQGEKSALVLEKATILSQLQTMTQNMWNLLENSLLENSISGANAELKSLREKSERLEELCQLLKNEKSILQSERAALACQLENVEQRLLNLEKRFAELEEKYAELEKEKESTVLQVRELQGSLSVEQLLHTCYVQSTESRFTNLENHVHVLQEENSLRKKDCEEELEKAVKAQLEIFILQKFIKDLEEKNLSLLIECQNHAEEFKLSDKLIRELESENLELQIETEFLLDDIQKLSIGIRRVFLALQFDAVSDQKEMAGTDQILLPQILDCVEDLQSSLLSSKNDKHQLLIENWVLLTLLGQLKLDCSELKVEKGAIEQEVTLVKEQNAMLQEEKQNMMEINKRLTWEAHVGKQQAEELFAALETRQLQLVNMEGAYKVRQEENSKHLEENKVLLKNFLDLKEEMGILEKQNNAAIQEAINFSSLSLVLESFSTEKTNEVKVLVDDLKTLQMINGDLITKIKDLSDKLEQEEAENLRLNETVAKLHEELFPVRELNGQLNYQIVVVNEFLKQKMTEILEVNQRLKAAHNLNAELSRTLEDMKSEYEEYKWIRANLEVQLHEMCMDNRKQEREIEHLQEVNEILGSEVIMLEKAIEELKMREENLSSELQEKSNEFELWEAEAASFYFDFQVSAILEVLLENKVRELTEACENLEDENSAKTMMIEEMKEQVDLLESEVDGLKAHLSSYVPAIASLKDSVTSLERNACARSKLCVLGTKNEMNFEVSGSFLELSSEEFKEKKSTVGIAVIGELQEMQTRINAVEKAIAEEIDEFPVHGINNTNKVKTSVCYAEPEPELRGTSYQGNKKNEKMQRRDEVAEKLMSRKTKVGISEARNATSMKDIQLDQISGFSFDGRSKREKGTNDDQMLELWESVEKCSGTNKTTNGKKTRSTPRVASRQFRDVKHKNDRDEEYAVDKLEVPASRAEPKQGTEGRKVLERLDSNSQRLSSLQITVRELRRKMEMNKSSKKTNDHEFRRVKGQLQEVEEAIGELANMNVQLQMDVQHSQNDWGKLDKAGSTQEKRVAEEALKGSEKIGRLQFEVESIQYILLKLEDERRSKEKTKMSGALLRDLIYNGGREVEKKNKSRVCWCARPKMRED